MSDRGQKSRDRLQRLLIKKREQLLTHDFGDLVPESITDKCTQFIINPLDRHMLLISSIVELTNWEQVANENKLVEIFNYYANILLVDKKSKQQLIKISSESLFLFVHEASPKIPVNRILNLFLFLFLFLFIFLLIKGGLYKITLFLLI